MTHRIGEVARAGHEEIIVVYLDGTRDRILYSQRSIIPVHGEKLRLLGKPKCHVNGRSRDPIGRPNLHDKLVVFDCDGWKYWNTLEHFMKARDRIVKNAQKASRRLVPA